MKTGSGDSFTVGYIDVVLTVWKALLGHTPIREIIIQFDSLGKQNPLNSVYKLQKIADKAKSEEDALWILTQLWDYIHQGYISAADVTLTELVGKNKSEKGKIDVFLAKTAFIDFILRFLEQHDFPKDTIAVYRKLARGHADYHKMFGCNSKSEVVGCNSKSEVDITWIGNHPPSSQPTWSASTHSTQRLKQPRSTKKNLRRLHRQRATPKSLPRLQQQKATRGCRSPS